MRAGLLIRPCPSRLQHHTVPRPQHHLTTSSRQPRQAVVEASTTSMGDVEQAAEPTGQPDLQQLPTERQQKTHLLIM